MPIQRLTPQAREWLQKNPGRSFVHWKKDGQDFTFKGDFYHKGVSLSASEVLSIQADHVYSDAEKWATEWNNNPDNPMFRFAGIEYVGPVEGEWWEDRGKKPWPDNRRYHKFGGNGEAYILTFG